MKRGGEKEEGWIGEKVCLRMGSGGAGNEGEGEMRKVGEKQGVLRNKVFRYY